MKTRIFLAFLSVVGLILLTGCDSSNSKKASVGSPELLTISTYSGDISSLFWVAKDQGYFSEHGVNVDFRIKESGLAAFGDMLAGNADLATTAEFVLASQIAELQDTRILAVVAQIDNVRLVARRDRGITKLADIRNKRIGAMRNSVGEYFLDLLLVLEGIPRKEVQLVDLQPSDQVQAIAKGNIDAAVVWEPFPLQMEKKLGANAVSWPAQSGQNYYWLLVARKETVTKRSHAIRCVLAALAEADEFVRNHRENAERIVASQLGSDHIPDVWEKTGLKMELSRPFVLAMEAEIRWMNSRHGAQTFRMPDLVDFIDFEALESLNPEKVKILH